MEKIPFCFMYEKPIQGFRYLRNYIAGKKIVKWGEVLGELDVAHMLN
jgi:hypothetical protein